MRGGYVYIIANRRNGAIYVGVTSNIAARATQHRNGEGSDFCRRYALKRLVYVEPYPTIIEAIAREKQIKAWKRAWKVELIEQANPDWDDLYLLLNA